MCDKDELCQATMKFLQRRTVLIVVTVEGRQSVGTFIAGKNVTIVGRGTGVLIERAGRCYVATNDHVLRALRHLPSLGPRLHVALRDNGAVSEMHDGYVMATREFVDDGSGSARLSVEGHPVPLDSLKDTDLALVCLSESAVTVAREAGREFVRWCDDVSSASLGMSVCFRGYPKGAVDYVLGCDAFYADGYSLFSGILRIQGTRIVVDASESNVCYGAGAVEAERDLHGISGSGLFDMSGRLVAIVYGGDPSVKEIFACQVGALEVLFDAFERQGGGRRAAPSTPSGPGEGGRGAGGPQ